MHSACDLVKIQVGRSSVCRNACIVVLNKNHREKCTSHGPHLILNQVLQAQSLSAQSQAKLGDGALRRTVGHYILFPVPYSLETTQNRTETN